MDIGDEPVRTFPHFCGTTLISPQRKFYIVVAQLGPTLFLQNTEVLSPGDFTRNFVFVEDLGLSNGGFVTKEIVLRMTHVNESKARNVVTLSDIHIGAKLGRKSDAVSEYQRDVHVCGIYGGLVVVAETRTAFIPNGSFDCTGWTVVKHLD